jgi:hypothetical protein
MYVPMLLVTKLMIVVCVVGMLRSSDRFQSMSREMDESAMSALKKIMNAAEEYGFPSEIIPLLMLLTALTFMLSAITAAGGR